MNYKTNITTTTEEKRSQIKGRLDDFATFVWRGENAFDICGAFIIADKRGDLKFYNGPSFSNEYTKPQFSSSSGNLTGISFNRQQVQFKMGAYWFSIEEWQDFIEWINAYEVSYLTFSHSPKYGYLVKLAKIADSPRYIVGYENGEPRYYTEMDLTWDLQGENCVRANLPYEWDQGKDDGDVIKGAITFNLSSQGSTIPSRLETPLLLTIPISYTNLLGSASFYSQYDNQDPIELFRISCNNLPYNSEYKWGFKAKQGIMFEGSHEQEIEISQTCYYYDHNTAKNIECIKIRITYYESGKDGLFYPSALRVDTLLSGTTESIDKDSILIVTTPTTDFLKFFQLSSDPKDFITQTIYSYLPTFKYDSETGVLLYTAGDTNWKLLQLSLIDENGDYLVKDIKVQKYKLKGDINKYHFYLKLTGLELAEEPLLQIYERTNVI